MSLQFACSFDAGTPLGGFTTATGSITILAARNGNGAQFPATSQLLKSGLAAYVAGIAFNTTGFANSPIVLQGTGSSVVQVHIKHVGDGRVQGFVTSVVGSDNSAISAAVVNRSRWYFLELAVTAFSVSAVSITGSTSQVTVSVTYEIWLNNKQILTGSSTNTATIGNGSIPSGALSEFTMVAPGGGESMTVDDIYVESATRLGDSLVASDDVTVTQPASKPRLTQEVLEIALEPDAMPRMTQNVIEVAKALRQGGGWLVYEA